jgi:hypothetical protein
MARIAFEDFGKGTEVVRIYLARELKEAKRVEAVLTEQGIEYAVEVEPYKTVMSSIFSSEYKGAAFYVLANQEDFCRRVLCDAGLTVGIAEAL